jgi:hypothetical protein
MPLYEKWSLIFRSTLGTRGSGWCRECVLRKESLDPEICVGPAPNTQLAPDEEERTTHKNAKNASYWDPEAGEESGDEVSNLIS